MNKNFCLYTLISILILSSAFLWCQNDNLEPLSTMTETLYEQQQKQADDDDGLTPLLRASAEAAQTGAMDTLQEMLKNGADPLAKNKFSSGCYLSTLEMHKKKLTGLPHNQQVIQLLEQALPKPNFIIAYIKNWHQELLQEAKELENEPLIDPTIVKFLKIIFKSV